MLYLLFMLSWKMVYCGAIEQGLFCLKPEHEPTFINFTF